MILVCMVASLVANEHPVQHLMCVYPGNWAVYGECLGLSPGLITSTLRMSSASLLVSSSIPSMPRLGDILNIDPLISCLM